MTQPDKRLSGPLAKTRSELPLWKVIAAGMLLVILTVLATQCSSNNATAPVATSSEPTDGATVTTVPVATTTATAATVDYQSLLQAAGFGDITIDVNNGAATLVGTVSDEAARQAAEAAALAMPEVTSVDNQLTLAPVSLLDTARSNGEYTTFLAAIDAAGLTETLGGPGPFTVFAPNDAAFASLDDGALNALLTDPDTLAPLLLNHTVSGSVSASQISGLDGAETLGGATVLFFTTNGVSAVDGAVISQPDQVASNGILHGIDSVLNPQALVATNPDELQSALAELAPITFETGSAVITAEGEAILADAAATISAIGSEVLIAGHTDDQGGAATNQTLSEQRAAAVVAYLVSLDVPAELLTSTGFGESQPVADNTTAAGRGQNRRIEFIVEGAS